MKITVDTQAQTLQYNSKGKKASVPLYSKEALLLLTKVWTKVEWNENHWQSLSWMGVPVWQLPEDMIRLQEVVFQVQPDIIIETGVHQGGSAVFFASLCQLQGKGRVISVDITIPNAVYASIQSHLLGDRITLIEGDSTSDSVLHQVRELVGGAETVMVFLDSCHTKEHVFRELQLYHPFVSVGSYIVATDGIMEHLWDTPNGDASWKDNHPAAAAREFVKYTDKFVMERPKALVNDEMVIENLTYWPDAWLRREA